MSTWSSKLGVVISLVIFAVGSTLNAQGMNMPEKSPRALVHLLDYLAQDYGGAVSGGKVISRSEYEEQLDFSSSATEINSKLSETRDHPEIAADLEKLHESIMKKASPGDVSALAQNIKAEVIKVTGLQVAPLQWPNLSRGQQLFSQNCVICHGVHEDGHGPAAAKLNPPPANLRDPARMNSMSPLQVFDAIRIGVPGTAMAPFTAMTDKDAWALAFYVKSLLHGNFETNAGQRDLVQKWSSVAPLEKVATLPDDKLEALLPGSPADKQAALTALRTYSGSEDFQNSLQLAVYYLDRAVNSYRSHDRENAKNQALMAYLEGVEPVEPRLKASDPALVSELENRMGAVRASIEGQKPMEEILARVGSAKEELKSATQLINEGAPSPWLTFLIAGAILLREGFEAVLIIIAFLGVVRAAGSKEAAWWIHFGWAAALGCGVFAWIFSGWLIGISGAQREMMEGVTSILAVGVLMYMGFWLHRTTEIGRWTSFINGRVKTALAGKNLIGLSFISFVAVFREAFETVLFLRALWLEGGMSAKTALASGVLGALAVIFILSWLLLKYTARIPIRRLFDFSSSLMTALAVILIGKGLHSLQETGTLSITASPLNVRWDLFGFYPTLETTLSQVLILALAMGLWIYGKKPSPKRASATVKGS